MENQNPESVLIELTNRCNYSCLHCYAQAGKDNSEIPFETLKDVINQLSDMGIKSIALSGGEPFLYPHIWDAIELIKTKNMNVIIDTNGYYINNDCARRLHELSVDLVNISLHGYYAKEHNYLMNSSQAFERTINALNIMTECSVPVGLNVAINRYNYSNCHKIIYIASTYQTKCINYFRVFPTGRAKENADPLIITRDQHREVFKRIKNLIGFIDKENITLYTELPYIYKEIDWDRSYACGIAIKSFILASNGLVYLCNALRSPDLVCGDIYHSTLSDIWFKSELFRKLRSIKSNPEQIIGHCSSCTFLNMCNGGCKACSYDIYHDFNHSDDNCWLMHDKVVNVTR